MSSQTGYQFLGKVEYADTMPEGIKIARKVKPTAGRLDLWTDQSQREDSYKVGLAVAYKRHDDKHWHEHYTCLEPDSKMKSWPAELAAVDFGLHHGKGLLRSDDRQIDLYCEVKGVVDRIRDYQPGDGGWGEDACARIHQCVHEIQQGKHWTEAGVPCVVRFTLVKAHAHDPTKGGDHGRPIMGNCWADYWASFAVDRGYSKSRKSRAREDEVTDMIGTMLDERKKDEKKAQKEQEEDEKRAQKEQEEAFAILDEEDAAFQRALAAGEVIYEEYVTNP
ncbi:hypothetical protein SLS58_008624 [Diplodia intermedia]|uniref:Uncharacterized protein n=1 Tax=Diplodia intermedia TaxID=856260 RepID=A0ABR3TGZ9_9PEZI